MERNGAFLALQNLAVLFLEGRTALFKRETIMTDQEKVFLAYKNNVILRCKVRDEIRPGVGREEGVRRPVRKYVMNRKPVNPGKRVLTPKNPSYAFTEAV